MRYFLTFLSLDAGKNSGVWLQCSSLAVDTCWAIDIWNPFHPFSIHFPCRYFRTICAFSIFFTCFQWFSIIVTCCQKIQKCYCGRHDPVERQNASIMGAGLYIWEVFGSAISMLRLCLPVAIESQIDSDGNRRCLTYVLRACIPALRTWTVGFKTGQQASNSLPSNCRPVHDLSWPPCSFAYYIQRFHILAHATKT